MNKKLFGIVLMAVTIALIAPIFVMGYGVIFGHSYSTNQLNAAFGIFMVGVITFIIGLIWSNL